MSVVFDFNASLNDVAPLSPILLAVDLMGIEEWIVDECHFCVLFLLCSLYKSSFVSVVFDFSASLNDVAPLSLMQLAVDLMGIEEWIVDECLFCFLSSLLR